LVNEHGTQLARYSRGHRGAGPPGLARADAARKEMHAAVQAQRLADIRKARGHARQADVAALLGVSQARVSQLESGNLSHTELGTLQSYLAALGGHLRIVAEFGDSVVELTT
jgi:predicted XRE-type DNA-binding protein